MLVFVRTGKENAVAGSTEGNAKAKEQKPQMFRVGL